MRTFLFLSMMLVASITGAQNKLTVVVDGIENSNGKILVAVYDSTTFLKGLPLYAGMAKIKEGAEEVTVVIEGIPSGKYAVAVFHDENDNNVMDTGAYGIPVEKYGFSNNFTVKTAPPTFSDCMFLIEEDTEINITLK
jgi:uncharacterized protein (DUF2141 family)